MAETPARLIPLHGRVLVAAGERAAGVADRRRRGQAIVVRGWRPLQDAAGDGFGEGARIPIDHAGSNPVALASLRPEGKFRQSAFPFRGADPLQAVQIRAGESGQLEAVDGGILQAPSETAAARRRPGPPVGSHAGLRRLARLHGGSAVGIDVLLPGGGVAHVFGVGEGIVESLGKLALVAHPVQGVGLPLQVGVEDQRGNMIRLAAADGELLG